MPRKRRLAVCYLRVSSAGQAQDGKHGLTRQRQSIEAWAKINHYKIVDVFKDIQSGRDEIRPSLLDAISLCMDTPVKTILIESMDRFARSLMVQLSLLAKLKEHNITLISCNTGEDVTKALDGDEMAEALMLIQGVFAQLEKKRLVNKLRKSREALRDAGKRYVGRLPYGSHEKEQPIIHRMRTLRLQHRGRYKLTYKQIAETLNTEGYSTRTNKQWIAGTVRQILKREGLRQCKNKK